MPRVPPTPPVTISIHALREEGDCRPLALLAGCQISIHALREEGDAAPQHNYLFLTKFLSTPSARRATRARDQRAAARQHFYPRPPRGGRLSSPTFVFTS